MSHRYWLATGVTAACLLAAGPALAQRGGGGGGGGGGHAGGGGGGAGSMHAAGGGSMRGGGGSMHGNPGWYGGSRGAGYWHYYPGFYPGFYGYGFGYYPWPYGYLYWGNDPGYYSSYGDRWAAPYADYGPPSSSQVMPYSPSVNRTVTSEAGTQVAVHVPADAKVWFDGEPTTQTGTDRLFESPPIPPGRAFAYDIRAQWKEGAQDVDRTQTVRVYAGDRVTVDFTKPPSDRAAMPKTTESAGK